MQLGPYRLLHRRAGWPPDERHLLNRPELCASPTLSLCVTDIVGYLQHDSGKDIVLSETLSNKNYFCQKGRMGLDGLKLRPVLVYDAYLLELPVLCLQSSKLRRPDIEEQLASEYGTANDEWKRCSASACG